MLSFIFYQFFLFVFFLLVSDICGLIYQIGFTICFVNKFLLEPRQTHFFTYCLQLLLSYNIRVEQLVQILCAHKMGNISYLSLYRETWPTLGLDILKREKQICGIYVTECQDISVKQLTILIIRAVQHHMVDKQTNKPM